MTKFTNPLRRTVSAQPTLATPVTMVRLLGKGICYLSCLGTAQYSLEGSFKACC